MCGSNCLENIKWCGSYSEICGNQKITTNDQRICANPNVFRDISCEYDSDDGMAFGKRCSGNNMECYYSWYVRKIQGKKNEQKEPLTETCSDKSDQIFEINQTCSDQLNKTRSGQ